MLLTIETKDSVARDLGFLLHKHPDRVQSFDLSFGQAHVFYPTAQSDHCAVCLLLDVDPVGMVRSENRNTGFLLGQYVNDRPYVASSFLSVAIAQVFGSALAGRCKDRPQLVEQSFSWSVKLDVLPVKVGEEWLRRIFEPLGYEVEAQRYSLDEEFPHWGASPYYSVALRGTKTLSELLTQLYVLIPVFDNEKHYFVGDEELEKLLSKGEGWLAQHPERETIARRYLRNRSSLVREALSRLEEDRSDLPNDEDPSPVDSKTEMEPIQRLHVERHAMVTATLLASGARTVLDLGCGEGKLIRQLLQERQFEFVLGMDVSIRSLELAKKRLRLEQISERQADRVKLIHGSLIYRDKRLEGFDAAAAVEVIEHLDPDRLAALERVVFEFARPKLVVITTPNREYNVVWESLPAGQVRHADHRFEWTRQEFQDWANRVADQHGYQVSFKPIGPEHEAHGPPTQMGVFVSDRQ